MKYKYFISYIRRDYLSDVMLPDWIYLNIPNKITESKDIEFIEENIKQSGSGIENSES